MLIGWANDDVDLLEVSSFHRALALFSPTEGPLGHQVSGPLVVMSGHPRIEEELFFGVVSRDFCAEKGLSVGICPHVQNEKLCCLSRIQMMLKSP